MNSLHPIKIACIVDTIIDNTRFRGLVVDICNGYAALAVVGSCSLIDVPIGNCAIFADSNKFLEICK